MNASTNTATSTQIIQNAQHKSAFPYISDAPEVLTQIYEESCNIAIWQRTLCPEFIKQVEHDIHQHAFVNVVSQIRANSILEDINAIASDKAYGEQLRADIAEYIDMFCVLFDAKQVGLRLSVLDKAMCPRFHVDFVPCRLVTTFSGVGTEWLAHNSIDRQKLGHGSEGKSDERSGLFVDKTDIQQLNTGDIALLKGEKWEGNEGAGLVHRSPALAAGSKRLVMTLDLM